MFAKLTRLFCPVCGWHLTTPKRVPPPLRPSALRPPCRSISAQAKQSATLRLLLRTPTSLHPASLASSLIASHPHRIISYPICSKPTVLTPLKQSTSSTMAPRITLWAAAAGAAAALLALAPVQVAAQEDVVLWCVLLHAHACLAAAAMLTVFVRSVPLARVAIPGHPCRLHNRHNRYHGGL